MASATNIDKALCTLKLHASDEDVHQTFGALCKVELGGQHVNLFVGICINQEAESTEDLSEAVLWFPHLNEDVRNLRIHRPTNMWQERESNTVVIELTADDASTCRSRGANFLEVSTAIPGQWVC